MRDATGAAWIFGLCVTFTMIFVAFLAISVNYARAFKIKSELITKIEEHEGYDTSLDPVLTEYLISQSYTAFGNCEPVIQGTGEEATWANVACISYNAPAGLCNACIYQNLEEGNGTINSYVCAKRRQYRVVTFFKFDLPLIGYWTKFKVGGESRYFYDFAGSAGC